MLPTVQLLRLDVEKAYQYEHGKPSNAETVTQLTEIRKMIDGLTDMLSKKDHLPPDEYLKPKEADLIKAFDLAIQTESSKLRKD